MPFQTSVRERIANGIPGELAFDGPLRALSAALDSASAANNVFGRAFTIATNPADPAVSPTAVAAGGTGVFAGIMSNPKEHVNLLGFNASFTLPNGSVASFVHMGQIFVDLANAATPGMQVEFNQTTGVLSALAAAATDPTAGSTIIKNAKVIRYLGSVTSPFDGLAVIQLTD